jgi:hypothetical protein
MERKKVQSPELQVQQAEQQKIDASNTRTVLDK